MFMGQCLDTKHLIFRVCRALSRTGKAPAISIFNCFAACSWGCTGEWLLRSAVIGELFPIDWAVWFALRVASRRIHSEGNGGRCWCTVKFNGTRRACQERWECWCFNSNTVALACAASQFLLSVVKKGGQNITK